MPDLKLGKLPDRTPVKIAITVSPELNRVLGQYAELYRATYGQAEAVADLIPFMLDAFLDSDRGFAKARKGVIEEPPQAASATSRQPRSHRTVEPIPPSTSSLEV
jgi:hypothetical protein